MSTPLNCGGSNETLWVVSGTWSGSETGLFSGSHVAPPKIIMAASADEAIREAVSACNCLELERGVSFTVRPVGDALDTTYEAQYDGPPLTDNHASTGAELKIRKFTQHETELAI